MVAGCKLFCRKLNSLIMSSEHVALNATVTNCVHDLQAQRSSVIKSAWCDARMHSRETKLACQRPNSDVAGAFSELGAVMRAARVMTWCLEGTVRSRWWSSNHLISGQAFCELGDHHTALQPYTMHIGRRQIGFGWIDQILQAPKQDAARSRGEQPTKLIDSLNSALYFLTIIHESLVCLVRFLVIYQMPTLSIEVTFSETEPSKEIWRLSCKSRVADRYSAVKGHQNS